MSSQKKEWVRPEAEAVVFECPRCKSRSTWWKISFPTTKVGDKASNAQCQTCHQATRLDHVSYPMVAVEMVTKPVW